MYRIKLLLGVLLLAILCGCKDGSVNNPAPKFEIITFENRELLKEMKFSDLYSDVRFFKFQTHNRSNFTSINKVVFSNRYVFVLDRVQNNDVFIFLRDGEFIGKLTDVKGDQTELNSPTDIFFNHNDFVLTVLNNHNCLNSYYIEENDSIVYKDRKIIPKKLCPFSIMEYNYGDNLAIISGGNTYNLCLTDKKFNKSELYFPSLGSQFAVVLNNGLSSSGEKVLYQKFLNDTIFIIDHMSVYPYKIFKYVQKISLDSILNLSDPVVRSREISRLYKTSYYFEKGNSFYLKYVSDINEFYLIRNQSGSYFHFKRNSLINDFYGTTSFNCIGVDTFTDSYVFSIPAEKLLRYAESQNSDIQETYIQKIKDLNLTENDNEILIFAKMK